MSFRLAAIATLIIILLTPVAVLALTETKTEAERLEFDGLDRNKDGSITESEFVAMAEIENGAQVFAVIDADDDEAVTQKEIDDYNGVPEEDAEEDIPITNPVEQ
jgi:hypothetical protein